MPVLVDIRHLVKTFTLHGTKAVLWAVSDVSFQINQGEILGLVGESGSGKTTVGRCLLRLVEPTSGQVIFGGVDVTKLPPKELRSIRPRMQFVFQDPYQSLDPMMTARRIILEPIRLWSRLSRRDEAARVKELADHVGLEELHLNRYPHQLSGGQQQRVGIARALAPGAQFLVLDEPTSALDPTSRAEIIDLLIKLRAEFGLSCLFISHDLTVIRYVSDRVAVMYLGKVVEVGNTEDIFERPLHPYTRALMSAALFADPDYGRPLLALKGEIPSPISLPPGCYLYSRCPVADGKCNIARPELVPCGDGRWIACFRAGEMASADSTARLKD